MGHRSKLPDGNRFVLASALRATLLSAAPMVLWILIGLGSPVPATAGVYQECWRVSFQDGLPARPECYRGATDGAEAMMRMVGPQTTVDHCWTWTWTPNGSWNFQSDPDLRGYSAVLIHGTTETRWTCPFPGDPVPPRASDRVGFVERYCGVDKRWVPEAAVCVPVVYRFTVLGPNKCPAFGNPIHPLTGSKSQSLTLGSQFALGMDFEALYDTSSMLPANDSSAAFAGVPPPSFGPLWSTSFHRRVVPQSSGNVTTVKAFRGLGRWISFTRNANGTFVAPPNVSDQIAQLGDGSWRYVEAANGSVERYDFAGNLMAIDLANGYGLTFVYSDSSTPVATAPRPGLLIEIRDRTGRSYRLSYEAPADERLAPRIVNLADSSNNTTSFQYDAAGNLARILWPDGTWRTLLYENGSLPWALTGLSDETGSRVGTYGYDVAGRAISTEGAGGSNRFSVEWSTAPAMLISDTYDAGAQVIWRDMAITLPEGSVVTQPNGQRSSLGATDVFGTPVLASQSQPAGSGCGPATRSTSLDANGNPASSDDFNGNRTCRVHDLSRNLETVRVEGIEGTPACAALVGAGGVLPAGARKISTEWHPHWRKSKRVAEPGRITTHVYNGQPDPFQNGVPASCAPSAPLLPDGKPLAVLCKQVEEMTDDSSGQAGFAAQRLGARVSTWTYNERGQVLTAIDPMGAVTSYAYYADTSFAGAGPGAAGHSVGDLMSVTNALGHTTTYLEYDRLGQALRVREPSGLLTTFAYDSRQRLVATTRGERVTQNTYYPSGLLARVTRSDGSWLAYGYDAAGRLAWLSDSFGNRVDYTLDSSGNRVAEAVRDPGGVLRRSLQRSFDALGRVQQVLGREEGQP